MRRTSRREFVKRAAVGSAFFIVPRHVLGGPGFTAPSDRLGLAAIGAGGKGGSDIRNASVGGRERVVALCDVDFGGSAGETAKAFPDAVRYADYRRMLDERKDIDAVTISTPDHVHGPAAAFAMRRGIHVYVQKPLTHNIAEARLLTRLAREHRVVTQMGNQGGSNPQLRTVQRWVDSGIIGPIATVKVWTNRPVWPQGGEMPSPNVAAQPKTLDWNLWLGPAPWREFTPGLHPFSWRGWWDFGTGALGDMGCHLIDIPFRTLGLHYPLDAESSVGTVYSQMWTPDYHPNGAPASSFTTLHFAASAKSRVPIEMTWSDGGIRPSHPEMIPPDMEIGGGANGVMMIGEKGIITTNVNDGTDLRPRLFLADGTMEAGPDNPPDIEPESGHQRLWVDACKAGFDSPEHRALTSSFDYAGPMTETVLMGNLAIRSTMLRRQTASGGWEFYGRKKLLWDGEAMRVTNLEEANRFVGREYRAGWEV